MFKALKGGFAFNNIANAMNRIVPMLHDLISEIENDSSGSDFKEEMVVIAYFSRRDILDIIEEHGFTMDAKILVTSISSNKISLTEALVKTVGTIQQIAAELGMSDLCEQILEKKKAYYDLEKTFPSLLQKRR
jgi:hypothetical protein